MKAMYLVLLALVVLVMVVVVLTATWVFHQNTGDLRIPIAGLAIIAVLIKAFSVLLRRIRP